MAFLFFRSIRSASMDSASYLEFGSLHTSNATRDACAAGVVVGWGGVVMNEMKLHNISGAGATQPASGADAI